VLLLLATLFGYKISLVSFKAQRWRWGLALGWCIALGGNTELETSRTYMFVRYPNVIEEYTLNNVC
jgi:hypothetical protein